MFAYPLPSIPTHFQPILIENQLNPIVIDPKSEFSLRFCPPDDINEQDPYSLFDVWCIEDIALTLNYEPKLLGCFLEAVAISKGQKLQPEISQPD